MRLGGAFPLSIPDLIYGGGQVVLPSGGVFYPPPGNYIAVLGSVTLLQVFDPIGLQWRNMFDPGTYESFDTDGTNWRLINLSGVVTGASITNAGTGGVNGIGTGTVAAPIPQTTATVAFTGPAAPGRTATGYPIVGGAVAAPTVAQAGTGFAEPPLVLIDPPPPGGVQATAFATLASVGGGIASITMLEPGAGYQNVPNFWLIPQTAVYQGAALGNGSILAAPAVPPGQVAPANSPTGIVPIFGTGTGALLNAATLTGSGTLTAIVMVDPGSLYTGTTIPTITVTGVGAAAATALMSMSMTGSSSLVGGSGYGSVTPIWETSLGLVLARQGNNVFQPRAARGVTTLTGGAVSTLIIEDPGFGFQKVPVASVLDTSLDNTALATFTPVVGGITDVSALLSRINS